VGVPWSNFVGIVFFHAGNCIDAVGMATMFDSSAPFSHANLPVLGMWSYCLATWFLVVADGIAYWAMPPPWGPNTHEAAEPTSLICPGQIIGSLLLLLGSIIYTYWAAYSEIDENPLDAAKQHFLP